MRKMFLLLCLAAMSVSCADSFSSADGEKPRVMVLTDTEIDDQLSMVRFLLSSNEYEGEVAVENAASAVAYVTIPEDAKSGDTIHMVCETEDSGTPSLTRYARVVITIR